MFGSSSYGQIPFGGVGATGSNSVAVGLSFIGVVREIQSVDLGFVARETKRQAVGLYFIAQGSGADFVNFTFYATKKYKKNAPLYYEALPSISSMLGAGKVARWDTSTRPENPKLYECGMNEQTGEFEIFTAYGWRSVPLGPV